MPRSTRIIDLSSPEIGDLIRKTETLILPIGSIECNGPHMPVSQDFLVAEKICELLGNKTGVLVAPTIPWGVAGAMMGFPGTISIGSRTLTDLVKEISLSFSKHGVKKVLILNTHYYNIWPINIAIEELRSSGVYAVQAVWWSIAERLAKDVPKTSNMPNGHGGEVSTSVVMAIREDLVDLSKAGYRSEKVVFGFEKDHEKDYPAVYAFDDYSKITTDGIVGDPSLASEEEGNEIIARCLPYLENILRDLMSRP